MRLIESADGSGKKAAPVRRFALKIIGTIFLIGFLGGVALYGGIFLANDNSGLCERMLFTLMGKTFFSDVYVRYPGGGVQKLSPGENGIYYQAHISRDGKTVVFYGNQLGPPRIWLSDLEKGTTEAVTPDSYSARHPAFSWDGKMIAFSADFGSAQKRERIELMNGDGRPPENYTLNIYVMDIESRNLRRITTGPFTDQRPMFSPDGKTIAFVSNRDGAERVWTVSLDGRNEPVPLQNEGFGYRPAYSPDGSRIYFFTTGSNGDQLAFINLLDHKVNLLHDFGKGSEHGPFVAYDGKSMLMHSNMSGKWEIWNLSLDDQVLTRIGIPFDEALHATVSENGIIAFDVPRINGVRKMLSGLRIKILRAVQDMNAITSEPPGVSSDETQAALSTAS